MNNHQLTPNVTERQFLLDFEDRSKPPKAYKLPNRHTIYVEYGEDHHVAGSDMEVYQIKRLNKPDGKVVLHDSHNQRYHYFMGIGYII